MAKSSRALCGRACHRLLASIVTGAIVLVSAGCSLFDWDDSELPEGYRLSLPSTKHARQTAADRGRAYLQDNRLGLAIEAYLVALVTEGRTVDTLNGLGIAYDLLGRYDLARQYYQEALSSDPDSVQTLNNLGRSYALEQNYLEAIRYYEMAMAIEPSNEIVLSNMGEARAIANRPQRMTADASDPSDAQSGPPRLPWVQVASADVQTLVTQANPALIDALRKSEVKPQLAAPSPLVLDDGRSSDAIPTVSPARHANAAPKTTDGAEEAAAAKAAPVETAGRFAAFVPVALKAAAVMPFESPIVAESTAPLPREVKSPGAGHYRVQLAAMRTSDDAERARDRLRAAQGDILERLDLTIERADLGPERGVYYRIQTTPLGVEEDAKSLCRSFTLRGQGCFVVRT
ncbi:MAG: tetratricopeptide repeat protein [Alphaproteobacteria bacterium]